MRQQSNASNSPSGNAGPNLLLQNPSAVSSELTSLGYLQNSQLKYNASSPDELALVNGARYLGAVYQGLVPSRDADLLGFGVAQSIPSSRYHQHVNHKAGRETVLELYYAIKVTPWLTITPDFQVITNPGGDTDARDALVGAVRVKIAF